MAETTTYYYIDDWTDEVMPCAPTLKAWAEWLSQPDEEWRRDAPAEDGAEFNCSRLTDLGTISLARDSQGEWIVQTAMPTGHDTYFLRYDAGGWDAEFSGNSINDALTDFDEDEADLACVRTEASVRVRFNITPDGPTLTIVGGVN